MAGKGVLKNSIWGLASQFGQQGLLIVFFVIVNCNFPKNDLGNYYVANNFYQMMVSFSALGLGQWFIRQLPDETDQKGFLNRFLKIQIYSGVFFYIANVAITYFLYDDRMILLLSVLIGLNIIFDNIIYTIRNLNIAQFEQNKTFTVLTIDSALRVLLAVLIYVYPYSIIQMSVVLVLIRIFTLNLFLRISTSGSANFSSIFFSDVSWDYVKKLVFANWPFIIVGSVSVIYWRIGNVFISKYLPVFNVNIYEVSFKFFSVAELIPVIVSSTIFAELLRSYREDGMEKFNKLYQLFFKLFLVYGFLSFTFIYSFVDPIVMAAFPKQPEAAYNTKEMFLTMLVFPTAILQANILIILKLERKDMWLNVISLFVNVGLALSGFMFWRTLTVINLSIFISFIVFHLLQDYILVKNKVATVLEIAYGYIAVIACFSAYVFLSGHLNNYMLFILFWVVLLAAIIGTDKRILNFIKEKTGRSVSLKGE
ncbi:oligosaccharide flippase family protein [Mucilaginibacter sp. HMF5004]|uniref:oligosaccharide flippase family protein n=1 Tax=Mucilaginibacter rivuli TaxID=2857527 RepID=UPI001C5D5843|nr:oligosaccharide flippase family protein [Mucilaginibacter rivuli]MBW4890068.1 oligosaccharide flippase family protein [Mucilaginibacter rivuli]